MDGSGTRTHVEVGDGVRLAVTDAGTGPAVVLLQGWPVTSFHWRHTVPALTAAGFRALAVDLRGLGGSSPGPGGFEKEALAADVIALADRWGLGEFAVVGHDWGGTVGHLLAADHPHRVSALAVEEEVPPGADVPIPEPGRGHYPDWHGPFNRAPGLAEALVPGREDAYYGAFLRQSAGPGGLPDGAERVYLDAYRGPGRLAASVGYYRTAEADTAAVRERSDRPLQVPVLAIGGEYGMGEAVRTAFARAAARVHGLLVPGAGHYPAEQAPAVVNPALVSFLRDHHPPRRALPR